MEHLNPHEKRQRQTQILERAREAPPHEPLSTRDLARQFDVSETTIRRDFQSLAEAGLIQRQYGGAHRPLAPNAAMLGQVGILLVSRIDKYRDPFYNMVLEGVDRALERLGYHIAFVKTLHEIGTTGQARRLLHAFDIKGMILLGAAQTDSVAYLRERFSPIVTVTDRMDLEDDLVLFDGTRGMRLILRHLASLGYRRPAISLVTPISATTASARA